MTDICTRIFAFVKTYTPSLKREEGQDLIEYAMLGGLIAATLVAIGVLAAYTGALNSMATGIGRCVDFDGATVCDPF